MAKGNQATFLTLAELRDRGWTPAMIRDLLGKEDEQRRNPHFRSASPVRLWTLERILLAESTSEFTDRQAIAAMRKATGRSAARIRASELKAWAESVPIPLNRMPVATANARAIESYNTSNYFVEPAGPQSDDVFLAQITVNFLRHTSTPYDDEMTECRGKPGAWQAQSTLRARVLKAISEAYPDLARECERQRRRPS